MKKEIILMPSVRMDTNKKESRNEHGLIRMSKKTRDTLGLIDEVELYNGSSTEERLRNSRMLSIHKAYSSDIAAARASGVSEDDLRRVGFVTTRTYNQISGGKQVKDNIWVSSGPNDLVIGADPEFILMNGSTIVKANDYMSYSSSVGCDGAMAELRPKPALTPEELVSNIKKLFADEKGIIPANVKALTWRAGCYFTDQNRDYSIGGHIHIGNPKKLDNVNSSLKYKMFKSLNRIMDELLSIPMVKIDGTKLGKARRSDGRIGKYGWFGGFRESNGHFEHRTLSGLWLGHPKLSTAVLGTAQAISKEFFNKIYSEKLDFNYILPNAFDNANLWASDFDRWSEVPIVAAFGCTAPSSYLVSVINNSEANRINVPYLRVWYNRMKALSSYEAHANHIDALHEILKTKTAVINNIVNKDLRESWLNDDAEFI